MSIAVSLTTEVKISTYLVLELLDVKSRRKVVVGTSDNNCLDLGVGMSFPQVVKQRPQHCIVSIIQCTLD